MIALPPPAPREWWRRRAWREYASGLFRFFARRRSYSLVFTAAVPYAAVELQSRRVLVNPAFPPPSPAGRGLGPGERLEPAWLEGLLAHEAGHVRFSCAKPGGQLGELWNALEDERVERLMAADHPALEARFAVLGDAVSDLSTYTGSSLEGCLAWRWEHDRPGSRWSPSDPAQWARVLPLVEAAWVAPSSEAAVELAREILELLGIPEDAAPELWPAPISAGGGDAEAGEEVQGGGGCSLDEPLPPAQEHGDAEPMLAEVEGAARDLASALRPPPRPTLTRPSDSRGRFDYGRFTSGERRAFLRREVPTRPPELSLRVCHDLSGSMGIASAPGSRQHAAVRAALMLDRACELANVELEILGFRDGDEPDVLLGPGVTRDVGRARLAGLESEGGTRLAPALRRAFRPAAPKRAVVVVVCDGQLEPADLAECAALARGSTDVPIAPFLIGGAGEAAAEFREALGRALVVRDHRELGRALKAWLEAWWGPR